MKHPRLRRAAAALGVATLGVGALVAVNLAASNASPQTAGGDRIAYWTAANSDGSGTAEATDLVAPSGRTFVKVVPHFGGQGPSVIALTDRGAAVAGRGITLPRTLGAVRDFDGNGSFGFFVQQDGEILPYKTAAGELPLNTSVPADLCPAQKISVAPGSFVMMVICEDGSVEAFASQQMASSEALAIPDVLDDVQQVQSMGSWAMALNGDGRVIQWGRVPTVETIQGWKVASGTEGKSVASLGPNSVLTTSGELIPIGAVDRFDGAKGLPADVAGQPMAAVQVSTSTGAVITRSGSYATYNLDQVPTPRTMPSRLQGKEIVGLGLGREAAAVIYNDRPADNIVRLPYTTSESSVTGATDGEVPQSGTLTGKPATYDRSATATRTDWVVDGELVGSLTNRPELPLTAEYAGTKVVFRTTSTFTGYDPIVSDSNPVTVLAEETGSVVKESSITGAPVVPKTGATTPRALTGVKAEFSPAADPSTVSTQWVIDGEPIPSLDDTDTLTLEPTDAGAVVEFVTRTTGLGENGELGPQESTSDPVRIRPLLEGGFATLEGAPTVGSTLRLAAPIEYGGVTEGDELTVVSRQWFRLDDSTTLVGEGETYTPTRADVGFPILYTEVVERFDEDDQANGQAFDAEFTPIGIAPLAIEGVPTIAGNAFVGESVTVTPAPSNDTEAEVSYQWLLDGDPIDGETGTELDVLASWDGQDVSVRQTVSRNDATEAGDDLVRATSESKTVTEAPVDLTVTEAAKVSGKRLVGQTVTGTPATFSDPEATVENFWVIGGERTKASGTTLVLTNDHVGQNVQYVSVATRGDETPLESTSPTSVGPVLATLAVDREVTLTGEAKVGTTLIASPATFTGAEAETSGTWLVDGDEVAAEGLAFPLTAEHEGSVVSYRSDATRTVDGVTETATSKDDSAEVAAADPVDPTDPTDPTDPVDPPGEGVEESDIVVGSDVVKRGQSVLLQLDEKWAGRKVTVMLFSTPRDLGTFTVKADGTLRVTIPKDVDLGQHRLAVYAADTGALIAYQTITVVSASAGSGAGGGSTGVGSGSALPDTGASTPGFLVPLGVLMLLAGTATVLTTRRRRATTD